MSVDAVCKVLQQDREYANCAVISFYTFSDAFSKAPETFYAECGGEEHAICLYSDAYSSRLQEVKNAVTNYLEGHPRFFIFDADSTQEYDNISLPEGFITRALDEEGYTRNFTQKEDILAVVERVFSAIQPTPPADLGMIRCALL